MANAGCLALRDGNLLVIEQRDGRWSVPGGTAEPGEAPRCTAYRETFEETGVPVEVGRLLHTFDNGFQVYHCRPLDDGRPRVSRFNHEVRDARWLALEALPEDRWRVPGQLALLRGLAEASAGTWE